MAVRGWIYVLVNSSLPGLVKVGYSTKDPAIRIVELSTTGVPFAFEIAYEALAEDPRDLEQAVHSRLKLLHESKEFFRTSPTVAVEAIRAIAREADRTLELQRGPYSAEPLATSAGQP